MATTVKELPIDKIELDYNNPRIAQFIEQYGAEIPSSQVALALGSGDNLEKPGSTSFQSLRKSIKTNGGIINPIIVNHVNNRYLVIEGNTRVVI